MRPHEESDEQGNHQGDGGAEQDRDGPKRIKIADIQGCDELKQRRRRQRGEEGSQEEAPQDKVRARGQRDAQPDENDKTDGSFAHVLIISCGASIPKGAIINLLNLPLPSALEYGISLALPDDASPFHQTPQESRGSAERHTH